MVISGPIPRHLRLYIPDLPDSYSGRLYFVLGPGLGDTVNDLRILHEVLQIYSNAEPIVYVDSRWEPLFRAFPDLHHLSIRWHDEAPSPMSNEKHVRPYHHTFRGILEEIIAETAASQGLVALAGYKCADQLARKEGNIAMKARAIGLSLSAERCRPLFPLDEGILETTRDFLRERGLETGKYFVVAPYTALDKMWGSEAWKSVITQLHQSTALPAVLVGYQGDPSFEDASIHSAIGLPLTLVAGLLAHARCFVGLDSGPTHLAACFDVPIVSLNPQGKFPPFLIEAHSPYRWTHLTPGIYGSKPITTDSVLELIYKALVFQAPPSCPLCTGLPYVLGAKKGTGLYLCRCGLMYRDSEHTRTEATPMRVTSGEIPLPSRREDLSSLLAVLKVDTGQAPNRPNGDAIAVTFEHWSPLEVNPDGLLSDPESRDLWWTWDAVYAFLNGRGWRIIESTVRLPASNSGSLFSVVVKAVPQSSRDNDVYLRVPWGRKAVQMKRSMYEHWLSWETFRKLDEMEGLGWHLVNEGKVQDGRQILRLAFALGPRLRTIERLLRVECKSLWRSLMGER